MSGCVYQLLINDIHETHSNTWSCSIMTGWLRASCSVLLLMLLPATIMATDTNSYTLQAPGAVLVMPRWEAVANGGMNLYFRTSQQEATLLYTEHTNNGYLWLRLSRGSLLLSLNQSQPNQIQAELSIGLALSDDIAHYVELHQLGGLRLILDWYHTIGAQSPNISLLRSTTHVYIGGVPPALTPVSNAVRTYPHFAGCITELEFANNSYYDEEFHPVKPLWSIGSTPGGCSPPCGNDVCNGGNCSNHWEENRAVCDCTLTRRGGDYCTVDLSPATLPPTSYQCFTIPPQQQQNDTLVIWQKAPTPHTAVIASRGSFIMILDKQTIYCSLGSNATISLPEPSLWDYAIIVTMNSQQLEMSIHSLNGVVVSQNSTPVGLDNISTADQPLCIGGGASDWPVYSTPTITAVYHQQLAMTIDNNCTLVTVSQSTCSDQSLITDPVHLNHTTLASSGVISFTVQLLPPTITRTILTIGDHVSLQYTDQQQLALTAVGPNPVVCTSMPPALVPLSMVVGYTPSSSIIYVTLNDTIICKTEGHKWVELVPVVAMGTITFLRSMVKCLENILYVRERLTSTATMVIQRAPCHIQLAATSSSAEQSPSTAAVPLSSSTMMIPNTGTQPRGLSTNVIATISVLIPGLFIFVTIVIVLLVFIACKATSSPHGIYKTREMQQAKTTVNKPEQEFNV